jgi:hypothetical protein
MVIPSPLTTYITTRPMRSAASRPDPQSITPTHTTAVGLDSHQHGDQVCPEGRQQCAALLGSGERSALTPRAAIQRRTHVNEAARGGDRDLPRLARPLSRAAASAFPTATIGERCLDCGPQRRAGQRSWSRTPNGLRASAS